MKTISEISALCAALPDSDVDTAFDAAMMLIIGEMPFMVFDIIVLRSAKRIPSADVYEPCDRIVAKIAAQTGTVPDPKSPHITQGMRATVDHLNKLSEPELAGVVLKTLDSVMGKTGKGFASAAVVQALLPRTKLAKAEGAVQATRDFLTGAMSVPVDV